MWAALAAHMANKKDPDHNHDEKPETRVIGNTGLRRVYGGQGSSSAAPDPTTGGTGGSSTAAPGRR